MAGDLEKLIREHGNPPLHSAIYWGDNLEVLRKFPSESVDLIYIDPPFSPDKKYWAIWGENDEAVLKAYEEACSGGINTYVEWIRKRVELMKRVLKPTGLFYFHCDSQLGHYFKVMLDQVFGYNNLFGSQNFQNEIIWHYTGGGRSKRYFSRKHDNIFLYSKTNEFRFNIDEVRVPYKETSGYAKGGIVSKTGKRYLPDSKGTPVDDVWDIPIINPLSKERIGYVTQKPEALLERMIRASSNPGDIVLDAFCGCGTTIAVAHKLDRKWIGMDIAKKGCRVMGERLEKLGASPYIIPWSLNDLQIQALKEMSGYDFQNWVLIRIGGERRRGRDGGIDLYTSQIEPVQAKKPTVQPTHLRDFRTALQIERKQKGYIVGFEFTRGAVEEAARYKAEQNIDINLIKVEEIDKYF